MKYIVAIDRPYYPSVSYFELLEEAQAQYDKLVKEEASTFEDAVHESKVVLALVQSVTDIKTDY